MKKMNFIFLFISIINFFSCAKENVKTLHNSIFLEYAQKNNYEILDYIKGNFLDTTYKQIVVTFRKSSNEYKIVFFLFHDDKIIEEVEIQKFNHFFDASAFDEKFKEENMISNQLGISIDLNDDGLDELILDYGVEKIYPMILSYENHKFHTLLNIDDYPISNVILPGAPDVFEHWQFISAENRKILLKRFQSDLIQYVTFCWNDDAHKFKEIEGFDFFKNTGFSSGSHTDFAYLSSELKKNYLDSLSSKQLRLLRNAIYAKYGRRFYSWDLVDNFIQCRWYKINENFKDTQLTQLDRKNIELIKEFEKLKGIYKPIEWDLEFSLSD